ncbi:hypothetical protein BGZ65_000684, partial [Modicella reniformis]
MLSRSIVPLPKNVLSLQQALELTNIYLENAYKTKDQDIALVLCHDAEVTLSQAKNNTKKNRTLPKDAGDQTLREGIAAAFIDLGKLLESQGYQDVAEVICKKAEKWGGDTQDPGRLTRNLNNFAHSEKDVLDSGSSTADLSANNQKQPRATATISPTIFATNVGPLTSEIKLPESDERLTNTPQLACCLSLLQ